jgi:monoamine oxidase
MSKVISSSNTIFNCLSCSSNKTITSTTKCLYVKCHLFFPVGGAGQRDKLAAPVERVLFFAGDATSRECSGTVHGALESGFRAADEVIG